MNNLIFRPIEPANLALLLSWFADAELAQRVSRPDEDWLTYVTQTPGVYAWLVYDEAKVVGQAQVDIVESIGYIGIYVRPTLRNLGYGRRMLQEVAVLEPVQQCTALIGEVEADNFASQRCVKAAGFVQTSATPDKDGFLRFTRLPT